MSDRAPRGRENSSDRDKTHRGEARRFLGTPMQSAMIRGLDDEERAQQWLGVANKMRQDSEVSPHIVEMIANKLREAQDK